MKTNPCFIDLFAGAGGLAEGFLKEGYRLIASVEKENSSAFSLETRAIYHILKKNGNLISYWKYLKGEIDREEFILQVKKEAKKAFTNVIKSEISLETRGKIVKKIENNMKNEEIKEIDVIIGGPPCQAYSVIGRNRHPKNMLGDHRNYLYEQFIFFLKIFSPKVFVFENVTGIKSASKGYFIKDFIKQTKKLGYKLEEKVLNAKDFLVLQNRKRLFIIGWKAKGISEGLNFQGIKHNYTVNELLVDLPKSISYKEESHSSEYLQKPTDYLKKTSIRNDEDILIQHVTRTPNKRDRQIYEYAIKVWDKEKRRIKYSELSQKLKKHKNQNSFVDRFKVVAGNLSFSQTVVAHLAKDGHYFIHPDKVQARSITIREAARLQSFPDNYKFEGTFTSCYRQIGNAVPPLLGAIIAKEIKKLVK